MNKLNLSLGLLLSFLIAFLAVGSFSQNNEERRISLKLYNKIMHEGENTSSFGTSLSFSPAISYTHKSGNFQEIELSAFDFTTKANDYTSNMFSNSVNNSNQYNGYSTRLGLKYAYNFKVRSYKKLNFYLGTGLYGTFNQSNYTLYNPLIDLAEGTDYPNSKLTRKQFNVRAIPSLQYNVTNRIYLDLNIPLNVYDIEHSSLKSNASEDYNKINSAVFPNKFTVNVGVGIKF